MEATTTDLQFIEWAIGLCFAVLSVGATVFFRVLAKKYNLEKYMPIFDQYVEEGIDWSKKKILEDLEDVNFDPTKLTSNEAINNAVKYVLKNAPETLKKLGVNEDSVREKVEAMIIQQYGYEIEQSLYTKNPNNCIEPIMDY